MRTEVMRFLTATAIVGAPIMLAGCNSTDQPSQDNRTNNARIVPTPLLPEIGPITSPKPEILKPELLDYASQEIFFAFNSNNKNGEALRPIWKDGSKTGISYSFRDKQYLLKINPSLSDPNILSSVTTALLLGRQMISNNGVIGSSPVFELTRLQNPSIYQSIKDAQVREKLRLINEESEDLALFANLNATIIVAEKLGLDLSKGVPPESQDNDKFKQLVPYVATQINYFSSAINTTRKYLYTVPLLDKDQYGNIIWVVNQKSSAIIPMIGGASYNDNGFLSIVHKNLAPQLQGTFTWDELMKKYPSGVNSIPGLQQYVDEYVDFLYNMLNGKPTNGKWSSQIF